MKTLGFDDFLKNLDSYLDQKSPFRILRDFIYGYFESEKDCGADPKLSCILPVLAPYFEYEEAFGDPKREARLRNLRQLLVSTNNLRERVVFALEFDNIMKLKAKLNTGSITQKVYNEQLKKLSPVHFDLHQILKWADDHNGESDINIKKIG